MSYRKTNKVRPPAEKTERSSALQSCAQSTHIHPVFVTRAPSHVRQIVCFEQADPIPNAGDHLRCGPRMILRDPCKYSIKVVLRRVADGDLHTPYRRRRRSLNSANEILRDAS